MNKLLDPGCHVVATMWKALKSFWHWLGCAKPAPYGLNRPELTQNIKIPIPKKLSMKNISYFLLIITAGCSIGDKTINDVVFETAGYPLGTDFNRMYFLCNTINSNELSFTRFEVSAIEHSKTGNDLLITFIGPLSFEVERKIEMRIDIKNRRLDSLHYLTWADVGHQERMPCIVDYSRVYIDTTNWEQLRIGVSINSHFDKRDAGRIFSLHGNFPSEW
jgi:hypothetical protein